MSDIERDPVFSRDHTGIRPVEWYFYDETWTNTFGPFESEEEARKVLAEYMVWVAEGEFDVDDGYL